MYSWINLTNIPILLHINKHRIIKIARSKSSLKRYKMVIWIGFFNQNKKIHKKFKQHSINIKNYTAHPHHMVHVPAKFSENISMRFWVTVRKLNVTDRQTDGKTDRRTGGCCCISRPRPPAPREIKILLYGFVILDAVPLLPSGVDQITPPKHHPKFTGWCGIIRE